MRRQVTDRFTNDGVCISSLMNSEENDWADSLENSNPLEISWMPQNSTPDSDEIISTLWDGPPDVTTTTYQKAANNTWSLSDRTAIDPFSGV